MSRRCPDARVASGRFRCWAVCDPCEWTGPERASGNAARDHDAAKQNLLEHQVVRGHPITVAVALQPEEVTRVGDPVELLELLEAEGCTVSVLDGQLIFSRPPTWIRLIEPVSWQLLTAVLQGAEGRAYGYRDSSGKARSKTIRHVWMRCDVCGEGITRQKSAGPKKCVITPGCEVKHQP